MLQTSYKLYSFVRQENGETPGTYLLQEVEEAEAFASEQEAHDWIEEQGNPALPYTLLPYLVRK